MIAKPIIDITVAVVSLAQAAELVPVLESLGYEHRAHDIIPERLFLVRESSPEHRTHHLNLTAHGSGFWKDHLAFRDYLRAHDQIAAEYAELKQRLAETYARTGELDPEGKSAFVAKVLALAEKEKREAG
jgi:GrpB-like predicted nucleotidyltransferase (UPF0157 family)